MKTFLLNNIHNVLLLLSFSIIIGCDRQYQKDFLGSSWSLISYEQFGKLIKINKSAHFILNFKDSQAVNIFDNCRTYECKYSIIGPDSIRISLVSSNRLYCPNIEQSEFSLFQFIKNSTSFHLKKQLSRYFL